MPKLECTRCGAIKEASTLKEAKETIDHGVGLVKGRPCPNDGTSLMLWDGVPVGSQESTVPKKPITASVSETTRTSSTPPKTTKSTKTKRTKS